MELQYFITGARNGFLNRVQGLGPYWFMFEKEKFHAYFRSKLHQVSQDCKQACCAMQFLDSSQVKNNF